MAEKKNKKKEADDIGLDFSPLLRYDGATPFNNKKELRAARERRLAEAEQREAQGASYDPDMPKSSVDSLREYLRGPSDPVKPATPSGSATDDKKGQGKKGGEEDDTDKEPEISYTPTDRTKENQLRAEIGAQDPGSDPKRRNALAEQFSTDMKQFNTDAKEADSALVKELGAARAIYENAKNETDSKEMWEKLIQGIGHLAAGVVGMKTGLNLDGLEFDKTDWESKRNRLLEELKNSQDQAMNNMTAKQKQAADKRAAMYQNYQIRSSDMDRGIRQYESERDYNQREDRNRKDFALDEAKFKQQKKMDKKDVEIREGKNTIAAAKAGAAEADPARKINEKLFEKAMVSANASIDSLGLKKDDRSKEMRALDVNNKTAAANALAAKLKLPLPFPKNPIEIEEGFISNSVEDSDKVMNKILQYRKKEGITETYAPSANKPRTFTLSSGKVVQLK